MLTPRSAVVLRLLRSGWSVACLALLLATLVEWGLISDF
jgi:DNA-binding NarL/FixJ family response regulator